MTPRSWERWVDRYSRAGFRVLAPAWPGMEAEVEALRADPAPIAELAPSRIIDHYAEIVDGLDRPPILIGHSFGGAFVQVLLDRGLGAAGVAVHPAPVRGVVRLPLTTLRAAFPILHNPGNRHRAVPLTPEQFHYAFANVLDEADSRAAYDRYHVPGAGGVLFGNAIANWEPHSPFDVNFGNEGRAPLLLVAGGSDHLTPPSTVRSAAKLYRRSTAVTGYREFPDRCHLTVGQPGWEEVADHALEWAVEASSPHLVLAE
ncbi:alpha/beta hydrolase [Plantactinospora sp. KBS50]|uniref:alpha/beta hydrolase n=1 Tax=Plantactinospora sp. KBS50 TaxID=2024580 RepID=UPI001E313A10|nr:alpha/beta fold hydrolase [Plantactinospora sp. KBS50]